MSTKHNCKTIDESTNLARKPEIITCYNATKGAVRNMDRMFYSILNIGIVNTQIIYHENSRSKCNSFSKKILVKQLMDEQLKYRASRVSHPKTIKTRLNLYGWKLKLQVDEQRIRTSGRCQFCDRQRDRKTTKVITNCVKLICKDRLIEICLECFSAM